MVETAAPPKPTITFRERGVTHPLIVAVQGAFNDALVYRGKLALHVLDIDGMSGRKYRYFINNLVERISEFAEARYLEIGTWAGSTFCSAIHGNSIRAVAVDNWSYWGGPSAQFFSNVARNCSATTQINVLTSDWHTVPFDAIGKFNIYLYDGYHKYEDQYDALSLSQACLDREFIFIVDDWNWERVRNGTLDAIKALGLDILFAVEVRTSLDDSHPEFAHKQSDWHNGYFISVLRRGVAAA